ncbi:MAG: MBL fold metallo-hydrolase [Candidatus Lokiarchaeota archaeon]|nr:MBL fold metallo-hydrolase [Candidatus Lokiarchaeota archaeon]
MSTEKNFKSFKISIVFDNKSIDNRYLTGFGFSVLIYNYLTSNYSLFDIGGNLNILIHNLKILKLEIIDIKKIILSHHHYDHSGGIFKIIKENPKIEVYVPESDVKNYQSQFQNSKIIGNFKITEIEKNIFLSDQYGTSLKEQALYLKTRLDDIVILVGCAHPGLEKFLLNAKNLGSIKAVIGGFHGFQKFSYLKDIETIGACHCTAYIDNIKKRFPNQFKKVYVGTSFIF